MTVRISKADWESLSEDQRTSIQKIITTNFNGETITADDSIKAALTGNPACEAACNTAEAIAMNACNNLPFPANLVCSTAAHQAGDFCRSRC